MKYYISIVINLPINMTKNVFAIWSPNSVIISKSSNLGFKKTLYRFLLNLDCAIVLKKYLFRPVFVWWRQQNPDWNIRLRLVNWRQLKYWLISWIFRLYLTIVISVMKYWDYRWLPTLHVVSVSDDDYPRYCFSFSSASHHF